MIVSSGGGGDGLERDDRGRGCDECHRRADRGDDDAEPLHVVGGVNAATFGVLAKPFTAARRSEGIPMISFFREFGGKSGADLGAHISCEKETAGAPGSRVPTGLVPQNPQR